MTGNTFPHYVTGSYNILIKQKKEHHVKRFMIYVKGKSVCDPLTTLVSETYWPTSRHRIYSLYSNVDA